MGNLDYKPFSSRHRPHLNPLDRSLVVTSRLAGSIPKSKLREYRAQRDWFRDHVERLRRADGKNAESQLEVCLERIEAFNRTWFVKFEDILHTGNYGPMWMRDEGVADKIAENLHRLDGPAYRLDAFSIMSNHVHTVFKPRISEADLREIWNEEVGWVFLSDHPGLARIMHSLKGRSARECNQILGRTGTFWEHESFDHVVRAGKFDTAVRYVLNNPVKAGLVEDWSAWRWNYCREELIARLAG